MYINDRAPGRSCKHLVVSQRKKCEIRYIFYACMKICIQVSTNLLCVFMLKQSFTGGSSVYIFKHVRVHRFVYSYEPSHTPTKNKNLICLIHDLEHSIVEVVKEVLYFATGYLSFRQVSCTFKFQRCLTVTILYRNGEFETISTG